MNKYLILHNYGSYVIEAEDLGQAVEEAWSNHTGYDDINAIIKLPAET